MKRLILALLLTLAAGPAFAQTTTTVNTELPAAAALADSTANPTVPGVASFPMCWNGTSFSRCGTATAYMSVRLTDGTSFLTADPQLQQNTAITWTTVTSSGQFLRASSSAPTAVTTDRPVVPWGTLAGALNITPTYGDVAAATGSGAMNAQTPRVALATDSPMPLPTGASTAANQTTGNTALSAIQTAVELIDNDQTGASAASVISAASNNFTTVKASPGRLLGMSLVNTTATLYYLRFYNDAAMVTGDCASATNFAFNIPIPASTTGAGFSVTFPQGGLAFSTGIGFCLTGGASTSDNTNAATGIIGVLAYK
jgi:hypothetical protein